MIITSVANPILKEIRRAVSRGGLTGSGCCVAETFHLLEEALRSGCRVREVVAGESVCAVVETHLAGHDDVRLRVVPDKLLDAATQGVVALVEPRVWEVQQTLDAPALALVIDGVQDPGNLGTILRSAEAFGATGVLMLKGTVNAFNPKALRASAGSAFRVPFVQSLEAGPLLAEMRARGSEVYAAVPSGAKSAQDADLTRPCVIAIGSEGRGVSEAVRCAAREITIPTAGVESLNAALAAAILLYEARRQRSR